MFVSLFTSDNMQWTEYYTVTPKFKKHPTEGIPSTKQ